MMRIFVLVLLLITVGLLSAAVWEIKLDGTGDFRTIGEGMSIARSGDTIVVYPGVYYETIDFKGKNVVLTSLYDEKKDNREMISQTVIDGLRKGSVVTFSNRETREAVLNGFTVRNGSGSYLFSAKFTWGGGIQIVESSPIISNCHVTQNTAYSGSGISATGGANPLLRGNSVTYNNSILYGAISIGKESKIEFCTESLNDVYFNYGARGTDIYVGSKDQPSIVIGLGTVLKPDAYIVAKRYGCDTPVTVKEGVINPIVADLYVSPDGDDNNSGLSPEDPLQTIAMALLKIKPDENERRKVYLGKGLYSRSQNNQMFPIQPRPYIDIIGSDKEEVILDLEGLTPGVISFTSYDPRDIQDEEDYKYIGNFAVKNLTIKNGGNGTNNALQTGIWLYFNKSVMFENINIYDCVGEHAHVFEGNHSYDIALKNIKMENNRGDSGISIGGSIGRFAPSLYAENVSIRNQRPGPFRPDYYGGYGGGFGLLSIEHLKDKFLDVTLVNLEVTDCHLGNIDPMWIKERWAMVGIQTKNGKIRMINSTIGNNYSESEKGGDLSFVVSPQVEVEVINSIVYGNRPNNVAVWNYDEVNAAKVSFRNCLIEGGKEGIQFPLYSVEVDWDDTNIDQNPEWIMGFNPDYPYSLKPNSPAINKGTLDIPDFEFPEFDLAGNPRIVNGMIDIGAYEYQGVTGVGGETLPKIDAFDYKLYNYPNPISLTENASSAERSMPGTTISFQLPKSSQAVIDIYNVKGQFVKRLINAELSKGEYSIFWNGKDEQERLVGSGLYMYQLSVDDVIVSSGRCTVIK
ncbi:MAG: right-handed parallel beta-helix repeat-containing protein [Candidatus Cloacimonadia bacterium]